MTFLCKSGHFMLFLAKDIFAKISHYPILRGWVCIHDYCEASPISVGEKDWNVHVCVVTKPSLWELHEVPPYLYRKNEMWICVYICVYKAPLCGASWSIPISLGKKAICVYKAPSVKQLHLNICTFQSFCQLTPSCPQEISGNNYILMLYFSNIFCCQDRSKCYQW